MPPTKSDREWREAVENALYVLAREQSNQSGAKPSLVEVLRRFAPDQQETRPAAPLEQRVQVPA
jgi:hypothetical protein